MRELNILFEDDMLIAVHKPYGLAVESANVTQADLISLLRTHLNGAEVFPVHRIDQPVEGIVIAAKTRAAAAALSAQLTDGRMKKMYMTAVDGTIPEESGELTNWLLMDRKINRSRALPYREGEKKPAKDARKAILRYRKTGEHLLEVELLTGRHHQIRAQLSAAGMPIRGDRKYGGNPDPGLPKGAIALCAYRLTFVHPGTKEEMCLQTTAAWCEE
ncbi:MAG: RluA family pseudouridine synthase [Lachnospiraceae bacterium]|nr:RluA family pseudouridine synthase [Lachnospiraceae bacterium]